MSVGVFEQLLITAGLAQLIAGPPAGPVTAKVPEHPETPSRGIPAVHVKTPEKLDDVVEPVTVPVLNTLLPVVAYVPVTLAPTWLKFIIKPSVGVPLVPCENRNVPVHVPAMLTGAAGDAGEPHPMSTRLRSTKVQDHRATALRTDAIPSAAPLPDPGAGQRRPAASRRLQRRRKG